MEIRPEFRYDFEGGFVFRDNHGFSRVGKGSKYWDFDVEVDNILKYGFNDDELVVQIVDINGDRYFIEIKKNENTQSKLKTEVNVWNELENQNFENYKWIKLKGNEKKIKKIKIWHKYVFLAIVFLILFGVIKTIVIMFKK